MSCGRFTAGRYESAALRFLPLTFVRRKTCISRTVSPQIVDFRLDSSKGLVNGGLDETKNRIVTVRINLISRTFRKDLCRSLARPSTCRRSMLLHISLPAWHLMNHVINFRCYSHYRAPWRHNICLRDDLTLNLVPCYCSGISVAPVHIMSTLANECLAPLSAHLVIAQHR